MSKLCRPLRRISKSSLFIFTWRWPSWNIFIIQRIYRNHLQCESSILDNLYCVFLKLYEYSVLFERLFWSLDRIRPFKRNPTRTIWNKLNIQYCSTTSRKLGRYSVILYGTSRGNTQFVTIICAVQLITKI